MSYKQTEKWKLLLLIITLVLIFMAACGNNDTDSPSADVTAKSKEAASSDITTVKSGVLTMATTVTFPPYEYYVGSEIVGIDPEIGKEIAERLGLEFEIIDMDFNSLFASVKTGKADIAASGLTVTKERKKNVNFTRSYSAGIEVIVVREDSDMKSVDDLRGALIGCAEGTTTYDKCVDDYGENHVRSFLNAGMGMEALCQGKIDCFVVDKQPALKHIEANEGLKILDQAYSEEYYAIAVNKENTALLEAIDAVLSEMEEDGTLQRILDKYLAKE